MRTALATAMLTLALASVAAGQDSTATQEVVRFLADYDRAVAGRDIAFLQRVLPEDYVFTGVSGRLSDRTKVLRYFEDERKNPTHEMRSLKHENVHVRVVGNMAVVTNDYTSEWTAAASPAGEPRIDKGRHTGVFEKRHGRWMVIAEQDTEQPHDDKAMEREILKAGREYNETTSRLRSRHRDTHADSAGDLADLEKMLTDEYTCTSAAGETFGKSQVLANYRSDPTQVDSTELLDQAVRVIDNGAGVETRTVRYLGTRNGRAFDTTRRYTATWVLWGDHWQVVAEHTSVVGQKE